MAPSAQQGRHFELTATPLAPSRRTECGVEGLLLSVWDDGPGLSEAARRHLFDPLYCGREAGRGMGLGLAKCWQIAKNHGGWIDVESPPGGGTRVSVCLPAAEGVLKSGDGNVPGTAAGMKGESKRTKDEG